MLKKINIFFILSINILAYKNILTSEGNHYRPLFGQYSFATDSILSALVNHKVYSNSEFADLVFNGLLDLHRCILDTGYLLKNKILLDKEDLQLIAYYIEKIINKFQDIDYKPVSSKDYAVLEMLNEAAIRINRLLEEK